jgi:hypothetical protein
MSSKPWLLVTAESSTYYTGYTHGPMFIHRTVGDVDKQTGRYRHFNVYAIFVPAVRFGEFKRTSTMSNITIVKPFRQIPKAVENVISHDERVHWNTLVH